MSRAHHRDLRELARALRPTREDEIRVFEAALERRRPRARVGGPVLWTAAGVLAGVCLSLGVWWLGTSSRVDQELVAEVQPERAELGAHMDVEYLGRGRASGVQEDVEIRWEQGRLEAVVQPDRRANLQVHTPEATVRVVGTAFSVERGTVGTSVEVSRGEVAVTCVREQEVHLEAGEGRICYRSLAAALGHLRSLEEGSPEELVVAVDRVLAAPGGALAARAELEVLRITAHVRAGHEKEALEAAEAYLDTGIAYRRVEILGLASRLAEEQSGCPRSREWLEAWYAEGGALPVPALVQLADCIPEDPVRARSILEEALVREPEGPNTEAIEDRLQRLRGQDPR